MVIQHDQAHVIPLHHFQIGEGSLGAAANDCTSKWQVEKYLKNKGRIFVGKRDPYEAKRWLVTTRGVFNSMDCPMEHRVRVASRAFIDEAQVRWDSTLETLF